MKQSTVVLALLVLLSACTLIYLGIPKVKAQNAGVYISKPVYPIRINASQIPIGGNYSLVYDLQANTTYHAYFYGNWINNGSNPTTDYDVYVYDPMGNLESIHTPSAGLPPHLGDNVTSPYFTPKYSGNYTFVIRNNPAESQAADAATFMLIQHVETNEWYQRYLQGTVDNQSALNTSWAFEFETSSKNIEIEIRVPQTLDMYEARLYLMANPSQNKGTMLNNVPLAWEPGLYGNVSGNFGGYNLNSKQYRGLAYASCEYPGQDMYINYTSTYSGESLYHLVLIGEVGEGVVSFAIKTDFQSPTIDITNVPQKVFPGQQANITFRVNATTEISTVQMQYTSDSWTTSQAATVASNESCVYTAEVPGQPSGAQVYYNLNATDIMDNEAQYQGSYLVKNATTMNFGLKTKIWTLGKNLTISGSVQPAVANLTIQVTFQPSNGTAIQKIVYTLANGTFFVGFAPNATGKWTVEASCLEENTYFGSASDTLDFSVIPNSGFFGTSSIYIFAGVGTASAAVIAFMVVRRRRG